MAPRSIEDKVRIDKHLRELFDIKLRRLPASLFVGGRKPTFQDVVNETEGCKFLSGIPKEYDLGWYFQSFNDLARLNFTVRKGGDAHQRNLSRAMFYLELDPKYSFNPRLDHARLNMLCMLIVYTLPKPDLVCNYGLTAPFRLRYGYAWDEGVKRSSHEQGVIARDSFILYWDSSPYGLITWTNAQKNAMKRAVEKLRDVIPPLPFAIEEFWAEADLQPDNVREKNATLWALRWLIHKDTEYQRARAEAESTIQNSEWYGQEMLDQMANMGSDNELKYLDDPYIFQNCDLLNALRVPVDEGTKPLPSQQHEPWMDPSTAISMVKGEIVDINGLIEELGSLGVSTDAMDTT
ncbi:hypothetical protein P171DRAFT_521976 [Karstenula rhodostoma CBS 690.94]|uniref:Uncharacterized protein n=1 Tax=Karstenula rhodostoma CBS 690.94 TaxID=1392251 RepID=A0A9P4PI65_9PLEO|nr:hypothetical protein P171DRAFT_521976 [Karstenula rhodostoma CBS 690.94]